MKGIRTHESIRADGEERRAKPTKGRIIPELRDCAANQNGSYRHADEVRDDSNAGLLCARTFAGLEVEWEIKEMSIQGS